MYEIYDPDIYRDGIPYHTFRQLREHDPVSWHDEPALPTAPAGPGFWAVMRHDDVQHVSKTPDIFSAALGCTQLRDPDPADLPFLRAMLLNMDPPAHNRYRRIISKTFTRRNLEKFDEVVQHTARTLVGRIRERGVCNIVEEVTDELALSTLAYALGVPLSDRVLFFNWANRIIGYHDDEYTASIEQPVDVRSPSELKDMFDYAETLAEYRRRNPGDDLISALVNAEVDGRHLTDAEFKNTFFLLAVAGNDTTRSAMPGALLALLENRSQLEKLKQQPQLVDSAVEESLRYAPPVIHFRRTATVDTVLRDVEIRSGQKVVVFYPSANRDPRVFDRPDDFDIERNARAHVSFGHGPHICVAAGLARLQMRHLLGLVAGGLPNLQLAGPVERLRSNFVAGIKRMPVACDTP